MKRIITTSNAPAPIGPYSQAVKSGHLIFTSGQLPIIPETGEMVAGGIREQTIQVLENLKAILEEVGSTLADTIKVTVFLADLNDFAEFNVVYEEYFGDETPPARTTVQVAGLPKNSRIEIELVAKV